MEKLVINDRLNWTASQFFDDATALKVCDAISARDTVDIKPFLDKSFDLNSRGKSGFTILYWALVENNFVAFEQLLTHGANPDQRLTEDIYAPAGRYNVFLKGDSVMFTSLRCMKPEFCVAALPFTRDVNQRDGSNQNLLHVFLYHNYGFGGEKPLKALAEAGVDFNARWQRNATPCQMALAFARPSTCLQMLELGADPSLTDDEGSDFVHRLEQKLSLERPGQHDKRLDPLVDWLNANYRSVRIAPAE